MTLRLTMAPPESTNFPSRLSAARETAGLTIEQIAGQLKITVTLVRALETGDSRRFPPAVFVRGLVRAYAQAVHLDPMQTVEDFKRMFPNF